MLRSEELLLRVWQTASRHLEIAEATVPIVALLRERLPLRSLTIWRLSSDEHVLRLLAADAPLRKGVEAVERRLEAGERRRLDRWLSGGRSIRLRPSGRAESGVLELLNLDTGAGDLFATPLIGEHGARGLFLAVAEPDKRFHPMNLDLLASLAEPLAVALDNDARLQELNALRAAAEADRQSLLRRLGRRTVEEEIIGESTGLRQVMERIEMVSKSDVHVLILGETGTGKEVIARAIHTRSPRRDGPFIRVNCGSIPSELIDSQLFGHERGSFTGATDTRQGWFERADSGTLFLDEIGELPLNAQVRLLRVLQDGLIERVGGAEAIHVNVRLVAATHRDLAAMVQQNSFREDLWYRIAVFPILLPPLRERSDDIPELVEHFARRAATRFGLAPATANDADLRLLQSYRWPGNIRELGAVIDRAAILGEGRSLEVAKALGWSAGDRGGVDLRRATEASSNKSELLSLDAAMRSHIELALQRTAGKIEGRRGAADLLGINPHTLRARMRKLGVDWSRFRESYE